MKISLNWLNDFIDLDKINCNRKAAAEIIAEKLTGVGFEVEEIIDVAKHLHHVKVGKILKIERHPEADRLFVCQVGLNNSSVQIITSATNVSEGDLVPVSLEGADLANGIKIKASKMRGVMSDGMFCSGEELGIGDNFYDGASVNGILIFKDNFEPGSDVADVLNLNDYVLDVSITANRPDCMSVLGIAREVSAIFNLPVKQQDLTYKTTEKDVNSLVSVNVENYELCPRYMAAAVENIKIKKSPLYIRARLLSVGIHPINNIVDITNYVLIEYGQPMHAFDKKYLVGDKIVVRTAKAGENISVLNGNSYELNSNNLVIADAVKPCVIAGVIGGLNSCINDDTTNTVFESAVFERAQIRRTSRQIGVRTDSCARFEKGVDIGLPENGLKKALHMVYEQNCGEIATGIIDKKQVKVEDKQVVVLKSDVDRVLGINVKETDIKNILEGLGIKTTINADKITLLVPPFRSDIENANDVAEEIIRMYGYDVYNSIDRPLFENISVTQGKHNTIWAMQRKFKNFLITRGFNEILSYSLVSESAVKKLQLSGDVANPIKLANPISEELATLRTTMAHSLFNNIAYNTKRNNKEFSTFESGRIYIPKSLPICEQPEEKNYFALASVKSCENFYTLKGYMEVLLNDYAIKYSLNYSKKPYLHPGISADIILEDGTLVGSFGKIHPKVAKNYEIPENTWYAELNCDVIAAFENKKYVVKRISKFPIVERDLALVADESVSAGDIQTIIEQSMGRNHYSCTLFDIYRGKELEGKKSLAFNLKFLSDEKTLTDEEINNTINKILKRLTQTLNVVLR